MLVRWWTRHVFSEFVGQVMVNGATRGPKERCWSGDGQEGSKKRKKRCFFEYVGQVIVKSVKKRRFAECVGKVVAKDADR